ncbi:hypothetical protein GCM10027566_08480 [Arachidicoccus ginsenosidivorans]|uniref:AraC family transcriptional regulator n=1 Tax=Arachidicoccus ginsenosidivorans TaxID=496057 RepID=A0A5B8VT61_9BACT|nr:AraC family transcriptional regulator [Arachidicoccus ginsenosidivorans]QEC73338.1 AraC family transcriptional regulator [Arachidicoccus ginsenosidivorans]
MQKITTNTSYEEQHIPVPSAYADLYAHFYFASCAGKKPVTRTLVPTYEPIIVFVFGQGVYLPHQQLTIGPTCFFLGTIKKAFTYALLPHTEFLAVSLKEDGFYRFFGFSPPAANTPLDPDALVAEDCFGQLYTTLSRLKTAKLRVQALLEYCKPYPVDRSPKVSHLIEAHNGHLSPIKQIAATTGQTVRTIQLQHKKYFGYSASERFRYGRFIKTLKLLHSIRSADQKHSKATWFALIEESGYYDQAQLIHDFQNFLQTTPSAYLKQQGHFCLPHIE